MSFGIHLLSGSGYGNLTHRFPDIISTFRLINGIFAMLVFSNNSGQVEEILGDEGC
ncbi:hypothetical protein RchiOBHm_Chr4g0445461 [Rosa chinensis]|uniref:Uncharacterized protein n=1 Tax=Rosa chinensis TaxID=74649 RepID=A0A2P6R4D7_ROSCH|nr:hypothetical protein RchiOBHm_Chr4g0445461 [Rosa chinensis]